MGAQLVCHGARDRQERVGDAHDHFEQVVPRVLAQVLPHGPAHEHEHVQDVLA